MNVLLVTAAVVIGTALAGCAQEPRQAQETPMQRLLNDPNLGDRIDRICALPPEEREAELEQFRAAGLVLHCGADDDEQKPAGEPQS